MCFISIYCYNENKIESVFCALIKQIRRLFLDFLILVIKARKGREGEMVSKGNIYME